MVELDRIKELAKENHRSFVYLSRLLGQNDGYLKDKRLHNSPLDENQLAILAEALNTTPEYLHGKTDVKEKTTLVSEGGLTEDELKWLNIWRSFTQQEKERYLVLFSAAHQE